MASKSGRRYGKNPFLKKLGLALFGLFLAVATLEIGLRLAGFIISFLQEEGNLASIKDEGVCRIMCLGESTTQNQYPVFLEEALTRRNPGIKFKVIDKGRAGMNTSAIVSALEANLDKYQPDIVVTMMGNNDRGVTYYKYIPEPNAWAFKHCRIYRFVWLMYAQALDALKRKDVYKLNAAGAKLCPETEESIQKRIALNPKEGHAYLDLGWLYLSQERPSKAVQAFKRVIELNPNEVEAYRGLGEAYKSQSDYVSAEKAFKRAIELAPRNNALYTELGLFYRDQGNSVAAEQTFKQSIALDPRDEGAHAALGWLYIAQKRFPEADQMFKKVIDFNPRNDPAYQKLAWLYRGQGKLAEAEKVFKEAIAFNPSNDISYTSLGWLYIAQKRFPEAGQAFKKVVALNPKSALAYGGLATIYRQIGNAGLSRAYAEKADDLREEYSIPVTVNNYRQLKQILDKRKVKLVCAQYPMRRITPLKKIFLDNAGVTFVDNEKIFKEAVGREGYWEYFVDMFGGDFGHCTAKGNRLLAENIAQGISQEISRGK